ncbi:MAG: N-acetylglucosaminyl-diphospho-decaprenol L-rhamnosyltransferase [Planctomycetota bacterium]
MTRLSVVIPVWNQADLLRNCLRSLKQALAVVPDAEVILIDDGSSEDIASVVREEFNAATLLHNEENHGFAHAANRGMGEARGEYLLLLNSDTEIATSDLARLLEFLDSHGDYAGVVPSLVGTDGQVQPSCMAFPRWLTPFFFGTPIERWLPNSKELRRYFLRSFDHLSERDVEQPPAACWLVRREIWEAVGCFDERLELFFNDVDWCTRLAQIEGRLRYLAVARVLHHGGASTGARGDFVTRWQTDRLRYQRKHFGRMGGLLMKACVTWSFMDWSARNLIKRALRKRAESVAPMGRAFLTFLRA